MKLRRILLMIPLLMAAGLSSAAVAAEDWKEVFHDTAARIEVEKTVYEKSNAAGFFIHVRITNRTARRLGIDLSDRRTVVTLNAVGFSRVASRTTVNEIRVIGWTLNGTEQEALRQAFNAGKLHYFESGESVDYFIAFNDGGKFDPHDVKDNLLLLIVDGTIFPTDGQQVYRVSLDKLSVEREVPLPTPLQWKTIPDKATVLEWKRTN